MTQTEQDRIAAKTMADIKAAGQRQEKWKAWSDQRTGIVMTQQIKHADEKKRRAKYDDRP
ncbi:MAG: hypothetical protein PHH03_09215 [Eubacteriales bacterium]|nr:hypothetical protein [Eubacteriales bacterium]